MCQSISSTLLARVPLWRKHPIQPKHAHLHPNQTDVLSWANVSRLNYLSCFDKSRQVPCSSTWHTALQQSQGTSTLQPAPARRSAVTPGSLPWVLADGNSLDRQQITEDLEQNSPMLSQQLPQQTTPKGNSILMSELGERSHRGAKELGVPLCTEERGRSWENPAAVAHMPSQHSTLLSVQPRLQQELARAKLS